MTKTLGWLVLLPLLMLAGCGDAISKNSYNTFLDSDDLIQMTDQMAAAIPSNPQVVAELQKGPLVIVMQPIVNDTNEIIPAGQKQMYSHRLESLLASKPALRQQFVWVLNRQDYEALKAAEGVDTATLGPVAAETAGPGRLVPQYALTGRFYALTKAGVSQRSDYYLCEFKLKNIATGAELWAGTYETKKLSKKS
ncbi:MAG: hypothetical protein WCI73_03645, partial [Phycisphaerae bacterium]